MNSLQPLARDMRINLRCRQISVAEQELNHPQIRAMINEMGGKGMAYGMGR